MKNSSFMKRAVAYLIDFCMLGLILWIVEMILPSNNNLRVLNLELNSIYELAINHQISISGFLSRFADIVHDIDQQQVIFGVINAVFILIYFTILPYLWKGQTLGKNLMKIQIVRKDQNHLTMNDLLYRNLIIHGLAYLLGSLLFVYIFPSYGYLFMILVLGIVQLGLAIISAFMVLYREDKQALHDILSKTNVVDLRQIEVKE